MAVPKTAFSVNFKEKLRLLMQRSNNSIYVILFILSLMLVSCNGRAQSDSSREIDQQAPDLPSKGVHWINSKPLTLKKLQGKVMLIDFWEYTCINCIRSFPFEKKLYKRYHDMGFQILGVHAPEFDIAYKTANVQEAVKRFKLPWPVAHDKYFSIWKAYNSHTWPNYFLIGPKGKLRGHYSGEGHDAQIERDVQKQLKKIDPSFDASKYSVKKKNLFGASCGGMTAETYVGKWHDRGALQGQGGYQSGVRNFNAGEEPDDGGFVLNGKWETKKNGSIYQGDNQHKAPSTLKISDQNPYPRLTLKYHAREIYSVMNISHAQGSKQAIKVYVTQDGHYLTKNNADTDTQFDDQGRSFMMVKAPRMYYLVRNRKGDGQEHVVTLWPTKPGLTVNSFTFSNNCLVDFAHLYSHNGGMQH